MQYYVHVKIRIDHYTELLSDCYLSQNESHHYSQECHDNEEQYADRQSRGTPSSSSSNSSHCLLCLLLGGLRGHLPLPATKCGGAVCTPQLLLTGIDSACGTAADSALVHDAARSGAGGGRRESYVDAAVCSFVALQRREGGNRQRYSIV